MYDKSKIRQKVWLRIIGHPICTAPVILATGCLAFGTAVQNGGGFIYAGILSFLFGLGAIGVRSIYKYSDVVDSEIAIAKSEFETERNAIADKREYELDEFRRKLVADGYPRDENLLDDLRGIANAFRTDRTWVENVPETLSANVLARLDNTFEASIASLDRSYKLRSTARTVRGEGKQELLKTSEQLLDDVQTSIDELGKILAGVTKLSIKRLTGATLEDSELSNNMRELRTILDTAERAETTRQQLMTGGEDDQYKEYKVNEPS